MCHDLNKGSNSWNASTCAVLVLLKKKKKKVGTPVPLPLFLVLISGSGKKEKRLLLGDSPDLGAKREKLVSTI